MFKNLFFAVSFSLSANAGEISNLAENLSKGLNPENKVAVIEFSYTNNKKSQGPLIIQERLTTELADKKITLIERSLIKKVMEELKLQNSGAIDIEKAAQAGKLLGADILILGTLNDISKDKTEINARCVEVKSGKILNAASARIEKTWDDSFAIENDGNNYSGKSLIQIALLLDTSGSMDGLINQTKKYLWNIVNELASFKKKNESPLIEVALYEYGNDNIERSEGYVRQVSPFTSDLDKISKELFSLKTNGGDEYCGLAIKKAVEELNWSKKDDVYKTIFIAGNEPFTQGPQPFEQSVLLAKSKGIFVNTIFCGPKQQGIAMQWKKGAELSNGDYANIDQNAQIAEIETPQDSEIREAMASLSKTYVPYGKKGRESYELKKDMDEQALLVSKSVAAERASFSASASGIKSMSQWDMISAIESGAIKRDEIKKENLDENLSKMSEKELNNFIDSKLKERAEIRAKIAKLKKERDEFIKKSYENQPKDTLEVKMIEIIKKQASQKGYTSK